MIIMIEVEISDLLSRYCFKGQNTLQVTKTGIHIIDSYIATYAFAC